MPNYKSPDGRLHFLESEEFFHLLPVGSVPITDEEAASIIEKMIPKPTASQLAQAQIEKLEREQMLPRVTREALLATAVSLAAAQGITEQQLYDGNIAYRKTKDFNAQIVALRAQL